MIDEKWFQRWMGLADEVASWSKDPNTKVGAVIIGSNPRHICFGYNGFPPGIADTEERLNDRELKRMLTQHAERNALDNCTFNAKNGTIVTTYYPCHECAKSIVSKGIGTVVTRFEATYEEREPWATSTRISRELFAERGVKVIIL
jgi:dCMP deaminase